MYKELLAHTRNGGAIVGRTQNNMVDWWEIEYLAPERFERAFSDSRTKKNLMNQQMIWMGQTWH